MAHQWILSCAKYHINNISFARFHLVFKFALMTLCIRMTYLWHYHKKVSKKRYLLCVKQGILFITYKGNVTNYHQGTHTLPRTNRGLFVFKITCLKLLLFWLTRVNPHTFVVLLFDLMHMFFFVLTLFESCWQHRICVVVRKSSAPNNTTKW